jgi:hypothetical protein
MKYKKYIVWTLIAFPFLIQLIKSEKNNTSNDNTYHLSTKYEMNDEVKTIFKNACNDCHSNLTVYPKYFNYQPVGLFLNSHVKGGKQHLNISEFTNKRIAIQNHKFEEIIEYVEKKKMPIGSYTYFGLHPEAKLSDGQRKTIIDWAKAQMDTIKNHYPADSLILKRS